METGNQGLRRARRTAVLVGSWTIVALIATVFGIYERTKRIESEKAAERKELELKIALDELELCRQK